MLFKKSVVGWTSEFFGYLGYIVSCGYPTRTRTHTRGNSVAHVWLELQLIDFKLSEVRAIQKYTGAFKIREKYLVCFRESMCLKIVIITRISLFKV
jgi:hypothetical protein